MPQKKKIIIHIGMPKTGTTALQGFFANHADRFTSKEIVYPMSGRRSNQHFFLASSKRENESTHLQSWDDLYDEVSLQDWNTIVLSSEKFFFK